MGGGETKGVVSAWEPPRRFACEAPNYMPGAPNLATEILVEARSGGTCVVRLVTSLFTDAADWDGQLESLESGWPAFLQVMRIYLAGFAGQRAAMADLMDMAEGPADRAFAGIKEALGVSGAAAGSRVEAPAGTCRRSWMPARRRRRPSSEASSPICAPRCPSSTSRRRRSSASCGSSGRTSS
jgi:hypothetical protein